MRRALFGDGKVLMMRDFLHRETECEHLSPLGGENSGQRFLECV